MQLTEDDILFLDKNILLLESLKQKDDINLAGEITALRRVILINLYPLIPDLKNAENERRMRSRSSVAHYYDALLQLTDYYQSDERKHIFQNTAVPSIEEGSISIEYFLGKLKFSSEEFTTLAQCEGIFRNTPLKEGGTIFTRVAGQRVSINIIRDDGLTLRIVSID